MFQHFYSVRALGKYDLTWIRVGRTRFLRLLTTLLEVTARRLSVDFYFTPKKSILLQYKSELWPIVPKIESLKKIDIFKNILIDRLYYPDEPQGRVVKIELTLPNGNTCKGVGKDMRSGLRAAQAALGESVERWALHTFYPAHTKYQDTSILKLTKPAYDLAHVTAIADHTTLPNAEYQFVYDEQSMFRWFPVVSAITGQKILAPLQFFSFTRVQEIKIDNDSIDSEPLIQPVTTNGVAAGTTPDHALTNAWLELLERDAFMTHWLAGITPVKISMVDCSEEITSLLEVAERYQLQVDMLYLKTDFPVHVVACVIRDTTGVGPRIYLDAKAGFDLETTFTDLLSQSLANRQNIRRFMDVYKPEGTDKKEFDHKARMHWWFTEGKNTDLDFLLKGSVISMTQIDLESKIPKATTYESQLTVFRDSFKFRGYEVLQCDLLDVKSRHTLKDLYVTAVRCPQLQTLYLDESQRCIMKHRLATVARINNHAYDSNKLNTAPHPFI